MAERALFAELEGADALVTAIEGLRAAGYTRLDAWTPYPLKKLEPLLGVPRSRVAIAVFVAAVIGGTFAYGLQWYLTTVSYPLNVGGRPLHSAPAFIPITFETTILFAAITAFLAPLALAGLPRLHHPVFDVEGFEQRSVDRCWLAVLERDPRFEIRATTELLHRLGARTVAVGRVA
jgi:hypothetical protein